MQARLHANTRWLSGVIGGRKVEVTKVSGCLSTLAYNSDFAKVSTYLFERSHEIIN